MKCDLKEFYNDLSALKTHPILYTVFTNSLRIPTYMDKKYWLSHGPQNIELPIKQ
jgi:hypothetical protein